jgi:L-lactate dehydrogenase complex protein LldG
VSLVPPAHVCLLRAGDLVEDLAEALARLDSLPSGLVWISGPSRSADLEMTLTLGVHGPASVDVVIVHDA